MKMILLTGGLIVGFAAATFAQGSIAVEHPLQAGFNTASSNPSDPNSSDFPSGTVNLSLFYAANTPAVATEAAAINSAAANPNTAYDAVALLEEDFTQEMWGPNSGSEAFSQSFTITNGWIAGEATEIVGTSADIQSGSSGYYAIVATYTSGALIEEGGLVLNGQPGYNLGGGINPTPGMNFIWPDQNLLIAPVPEPTTLALTGLGALSLVALRRRLF